MTITRASVVLALSVAACSTPPVEQPEPTVVAQPEPPASTPPVTESAEVVAAPKKPTPCGELGCLLYDTPEAAFRAVLDAKPLVVAVGEAHAQQGSEGIPSATNRFREQLLPVVGKQASDLVLELMTTEGKCKKTQKKVAKTQKQVTKKQAGSNQNEFLLLGNKSKELGIRPHVLRPSCDDYEKVVAAGPDGIMQMLTMIADLSDELLGRILERNHKQGSSKMVLAYGGAMHNDLKPREGREPWSFGPRMSKRTQGRYVEVDLIVPEFIKDTDTWRKLPWYPHFDREHSSDKVTLFNTSPGAYVLIFAATKR